jgi:hypothetical protein
MLVAAPYVNPAALSRMDGEFALSSQLQQA